MARWGKNIVVPLESLIKEKENTNRPTAARSAGTVGKWGKMGFTSTRTYALKVLPPPISPVQSPEGGDTQVSQTNDTPKPKKFFKSRNSSVDVIRTQIIHHLPRAPPSPIRDVSPQKREPPLKIKIPKPTVERKKSSSSDRGIQKNEKKKKEKKLKPEAPPSRVISRHRKIVNYAEDDDESSQTPFREINVPISVPINEDTILIEEEKSEPTPEPEQKPECDPESKLEPQIESDLLLESESQPDPEPEPVRQPEPEPVDATMDPPQAAHKAANIDHPPIVLRISKGTSRLISTDSEDIINSPTYEPPILEATIKSTNDSPPPHYDGPQTCEEVEDDQIEKELAEIDISPALREATEINCEAKRADEPPKLESLKIVIKADILKNAVLFEKSERKGRSKRHHKPSTINQKIVENQFKTPSPAQVNDYDLYKTLVTSPSERDFDSQSSVLGSISSKGMNLFPAVISDENCVIRSRGSSDVTSELESSQHSSLVAPPSDIESRLESMMDGEDEDQAGLTEANSHIRCGNLLQIEEEPLKEDILEVLTGETREKIDEDKDTTISQEYEPQSETNLEPEPEQIESEMPEKETSRRLTRSRRGTAKGNITESTTELQIKTGRVTRNNNNGILKNKLPAAAPIRSYSRKRRNNTNLENVTSTEILPKEKPLSDLHLDDRVELASSIDLPDAPAPPADKSGSPDKMSILDEQLISSENTEKEYKITSKFKRTWYERSTRSSELDKSQEPLTKKSCSNSEKHLNVKNKPGKNVNNNNFDNGEAVETDAQVNDDEKRSVKLVISKKKGSIFKSRAFVSDQGDSKKRHVYKHTWDAEDKKEKSVICENQSTTSAAESIFDDFSDIESTSKLTRLTKQNAGKFESETVTSVKCDKKAKEYYTVVRNVKTAHQIQEIGEYQEMDDDVEYILDALQPHNPISTRCLSALQLASKCMTPAFRMHVRAHGTVTKFFRALRDSKKDLSLGLCTATIMYVLSQDTLNMDLDRDSLELMMSLLEADASNIVDECGLANFERNKLKVKELCEEIKSQGKAAHLNIESISVGTLAMETLLSLTSKRAGEWFKEELRELGGLEHIIKTICECCHQISDYVVSWTEVLLDKLRTIERCLRVLENVSQQNEMNQDYILSYNNGGAVNTLFKLYKLCDSEIALYPTNDSTPKENPGVVLREALVPTLKVLINLTHPFDNRAVGSAILGQRDGIFDTSFHILLQAPNYIPERCIFDLSILVLLLLINLTMYTIPNRALIMRSHAPSDFGNQFDKVPAIKALIEYFYRCEEQARLAEQNTNAILENPEPTNKKPQSQEEVDETVTKLLQKAGHHMEHTLQASYAGILIGHLISDSEENEEVIRVYLKDSSFQDIISILDKYYNFMNLTASSEAIVVSHIKSTKKLIDYFKKCNQHSSTSSENDQIEPAASSSSISTRSTQRVYKTYSQR